MAARGLTDIYTQLPVSKRECGHTSKSPSMSMLQHLCNTFSSCVQHCALLPKHDNIVSKVPHSMMLPYRSHISEAKEKTRWLRKLAIML